MVYKPVITLLYVPEFFYHLQGGIKKEIFKCLIVYYRRAIIELKYKCYMITLFKKCNHFNVCILIILLRIYGITRHLNFCCCWIPSRRWPKKTETCSRISTCSYINVSNYNSVVIRIYVYGDLSYSTEYG